MKAFSKTGLTLCVLALAGCGGGWGRYTTKGVAKRTEIRLLNSKGELYQYMAHRVTVLCPNGYVNKGLMATIEKRGTANYWVRGWIFYECN